MGKELFFWGGPLSWVALSRAAGAAVSTAPSGVAGAAASGRGCRNLAVPVMGKARGLIGWAARRPAVLLRSVLVIENEMHVDEGGRNVVFNPNTTWVVTPILHCFLRCGCLGNLVCLGPVRVLVPLDGDHHHRRHARQSRLQLSTKYRRVIQEKYV